MSHPVEAIAEVLAGDGLVSSIFPGGVYVAATQGASQINPKDTPAAYTTEAGSGVKLLQPFLMVRSGSETPPRPGDIRRFVFIHVDGYQPEGYSEIRDGHARVRQVLDKSQGTWRGTPGEGGLRNTIGYYIEYQNTNPQNQTDASLVVGANKRPACWERMVFLCVTEYEA